jgi:hypothetical protein
MKELGERISAAVTLLRRAVAVGFLHAAPAELEKFEGSEPSGCSFWRLAAAGKSFYTVPENHFNCAAVWWRSSRGREIPRFARNDGCMGS